MTASIIRSNSTGNAPRPRHAQAARDLDLHENVLRNWVHEAGTDGQHAFSGHGQMKPEQQEIDRLRKEVAKLKAGAVNMS